MHLQPACLLLSLLITTSSLSGIEIFLKNGDRLQGDLVVESDDHITLRHPILGDIEIAKKNLAEWPIPEKPTAPIVAKPETNPTPTAKAKDAQKPSKPEVAKKGEPKKMKPEEAPEETGVTPTTVDLSQKYLCESCKILQVSKL
jgi:outer membrane biosynthesis protein TonB